MMALLFATVVAAVPATSVTDTTQLRATLERVAASHEGVAGISVRNLKTGEAISIRGHETFPTARRALRTRRARSIARAPTAAS